MRKINSPAETAGALDEVVFQASLHALLSAVGQLERRDVPPSEAMPLQPVAVRIERSTK
jgi:hypothetical protein